MREYGQIQCSYWTDPDIQALSDKGKLLGAYILSGPHSNGLGCYRLPDGYIMADFGWDKSTVSKAFMELFNIGFAKRCMSTNFVLIPKFLKWNPIANGNVAAARVKEFNTVSKKSDIYQELCICLTENGKHFKEGFLNRLETLSKGYGKQDPTLPNPNPTQPDSCPEPQSDSEPAVEELTIIAMPLVDKSEFLVTDGMFSEWREAYPAVDVRQVLNNIRQWNLSNPTKQKTKRGIRSHITTWLAKEQDKGGTNGITQINSRPSAVDRVRAANPLGSDPIDGKCKDIN